MKARHGVRWAAGAVVGVALGLAVGGCDGEAGGGPTPVELRFAGRVGALDFACDAAFEGLGTMASTVEPLDFRLYVHDVRVVDAEGQAWPVTLEQDGLWQHEGVALLDFEDKTGTCVNGTAATNALVRGTHEARSGAAITGVAFKVGVPLALNHADVATAPSPLNLSGLFWNWQGGYKFARVDVAVVADGEAPAAGFNIHLGSTGCTLDPGTQQVGSCAAPNRPEIALDGFVPTRDTIVVDLAALVAGLDLSKDAGGVPGCMSGQDDPECEVIFAHFGLDLVTGLPREGQTAFRVE